MDANTLAIVIAIIAATVAEIVTVVVALYVSIQQGNKYEAAINGLRSELRGEIRALGEHVEVLGERFGSVESRQSRLEGVNETLAEILRRQSHTHEAAD